MNTLYLIRHGKTEANLRHLYCGSTDLPLSPEGIAQLKCLRYPAYKGVYITSGMRRTEETLALLFGPVPHRQDARFREVDFGLFEMKSYQELKEDPAYSAWISGDNESNIPPRGESGKQMERRVLEGLSQLRSLSQDVVLIAHGGVIACMMAAMFPQEGKNRYGWQPEPGQGYCVSAEGYRRIPE